MLFARMAPLQMRYIEIASNEGGSPFGASEAGAGESRPKETKMYEDRCVRVCVAVCGSIGGLSRTLGFGQTRYGNE